MQEFVHEMKANPQMPEFRETIQSAHKCRCLMLEAQLHPAMVPFFCWCHSTYSILMHASILQATIALANKIGIFYAGTRLLFSILMRRSVCDHTNMTGWFTFIAEWQPHVTNMKWLSSICCRRNRYRCPKFDLLCTSPRQQPALLLLPICILQ